MNTGKVKRNPNKINISILIMILYLLLDNVTIRISWAKCIRDLLVLFLTIAYEPN
jgi:hypothetical protein